MSKAKVAATDASIEVTNENFGELLLESAAEAVEIHEGRAAPARVHSYPALTARDVEVEAPPTLTAEEIRALRKQLQLSQEVFARLCNVSLYTDRSWEQGHRVPDGAAVRLFQLIKRDPGLVRQLVKPLTKAARRSAPYTAKPKRKAAAGQ